MRRLRLAVLPAVLALALGACGGDEEEEAQTNGQGGEPPAAEETQPPPETRPLAQPTPQEREEVLAAVREYLNGLARQNAPQACDALTEDAQRLLGRDLQRETQGCEDAVREASEFSTRRASQALRDADALHVNVKDDIATVDLRIADQSVPIQLERDDEGEWLVSNANERELREALP